MIHEIQSVRVTKREEVKMPHPVFTVQRGEPQLIAPSNPTPCEFKYLSNIDDQRRLRRNNTVIQFYRNDGRMEGNDPVKVIKEALAKALVHYYPLAGRLREGRKGKLVVECTGEGVLFIEATASVSLDQFGDVLHPPFQGAEKLLYNVPGSDAVLHCPLFLIQVTVLTCGGFIFALRHSHVICDATGVVQFMTAIGEIARGADGPSVEPVWDRELLRPRDPPKISCSLYAFQKWCGRSPIPLVDRDQLVKRSFFIGIKELEDIKHHLSKCSKVDVLVAYAWRCRTIALDFGSEDEIRLGFVVNARKKFNPPLPVGFYGNAHAKPIAISTAGQLRCKPLSYPVELIQSAKAEVTEEFVRSTIDLLEDKNQPPHEITRTFHVSDLTKMGLIDVDFGWGKAEYGGPTWGGYPSSFLVSSKNSRGEDGIVLTMDLPGRSMEIFALEIGKIKRFTGPGFPLSAL